jgi:hypothetical protein
MIRPRRVCWAWRLEDDDCIHNTTSSRRRSDAGDGKRILKEFRVMVRTAFIWLALVKTIIHLCVLHNLLNYLTNWGTRGTELHSQRTGSKHVKLDETTGRSVPEHRHPYNRRRENLKSHLVNRYGEGTTSRVQSPSNYSSPWQRRQ